jgi:hypothetical protein
MPTVPAGFSLRMWKAHLLLSRLCVDGDESTLGGSLDLESGGFLEHPPQRDVMNADGRKMYGTWVRAAQPNPRPPSLKRKGAQNTPLLVGSPHDIFARSRPHPSPPRGRGGSDSSSPVHGGGQEGGIHSNFLPSEKVSCSKARRRGDAGESHPPYTCFWQGVHPKTLAATICPSAIPPSLGGTR